MTDVSAAAPSSDRSSMEAAGGEKKKKKYTKFDVARDDLRVLVDPDRLPSTFAAYCHSVTEADHQAHEKHKGRQLIPHRPSSLQMAAKRATALCAGYLTGSSQYLIGL